MGRLIAVGRQLPRVAQALVPRRVNATQCLCYHLVGGGTDSAVDIAEGDFDQVLEAIVAMGMGQGHPSFRLTEAPDDGPRVDLTFDDAYENFYRNVWPRLLTASVRATLCVPVGFVNGTSPSPIRGLEGQRPVTWGMLREMHASGVVTIASHTLSHPDLRTLSGTALVAEIRDSRAELEQRLGAAVDTFCYPRALWSLRVERVVQQHYDFAYVGGGWSVTARNLRPFRIWRTSVRRDHGAKTWPAGVPIVDLEEWVADAWRRYRG